MKSLKRLDCSNNPIGGTIPEDWCYWDATNYLGALQTLACAGCGLTGTLPRMLYCTALLVIGLPGG